MISTIISIFGTNLFTAIFKSAVKKYGDRGVHVIVFLCALSASSIICIIRQYPSAMEITKEMGLKVLEIGAGAIAMYQVVWKQLGGFLGMSNSDLEA